MKPIDFQPRRFLTYRSTVLYIASLAIAVASICRAEDIGIPTIDLDQRSDLQVIVDRQPKVYLGHPTTLLLEDGKTILCVYPKGHGKGPILYKRSSDGGATWSDHLPTPKMAKSEFFSLADSIRFVNRSATTTE